MGKPFDKEDLSQSGLIFCSCLIFLLDFLDDVFVVSETLAILRIFFVARARHYMWVCRAIGSQTRTLFSRAKK